jgi:hypothetical protein
LSVVHELAIDGAADKLRDYLDSYPDGIDLNALDAYGFAPLHLAADRGAPSCDVKIIQMHAHNHLRCTQAMLKSYVYC